MTGKGEIAMSQFPKLSVIASLICAGATEAAPQAPTVDWKKQEAEILRHHRALVQIDTSPPSHETKVDDYLKRVLEDEVIPVKTFALDPDRANLVARLKGNG